MEKRENRQQENKQKKKLLSIIVPCFNEEQMLGLFHREVTDVLKDLPRDRYEYELILVNDGSRDGTLSIMMELAEKDPHVNYLSLSRNFGKESAMLAGIENAAGDCTVIMDADLQHPPELILQMIEKYEEGFDQVIAKRNRKGDSRKSAVMANLYYKMINKITDVKLENGAGDFRLLGRNALDALISLKETNRFSKGLFTWVGFRQTVIEYENRPRAKDRSKWSFKALLRYGIDGILSFNMQPLRICVYLGGSLLAISMLYLVYLFIRILLHGIDVPGYFTTIALISVLGGVQLISLGIIGEYVGRIYAEVKRRPPYIIAASGIRRKRDGEVSREAQEKPEATPNRKERPNRENQQKTEDEQNREKQQKTEAEPNGSEHPSRKPQRALRQSRETAKTPKTPEKTEAGAKNETFD